MFQESSIIAKPAYLGKQSTQRIQSDSIFGLRGSGGTIGPMREEKRD